VSRRAKRWSSGAYSQTSRRRASATGPLVAASALEVHARRDRQVAMSVGERIAGGRGDKARVGGKTVNQASHFSVVKVAQTGV
jgi:hypothetical protein